MPSTEAADQSRCQKIRNTVKYTLADPASVFFIITGLVMIEIGVFEDLRGPEGKQWIDAVGFSVGGAIMTIGPFIRIAYGKELVRNDAFRNVAQPVVSAGLAVTSVFLILCGIDTMQRAGICYNSMASTITASVLGLSSTIYFISLMRNMCKEHVAGQDPRHRSGSINGDADDYQEVEDGEFSEPSSPTSPASN